MERALYGPTGSTRGGAGRPAWRLPHVARGRPAVRRRAGPFPRRRVGASRAARRRSLSSTQVLDPARWPGRSWPPRRRASPCCATSRSRSRTSSGRRTRPVSSRGATCRSIRFVGVVIANELLDNLPFRLAVFDGAWREAYVDTSRDGTLTEVLSAPFDPVPPSAGDAPRTAPGRRCGRRRRWSTPPGHRRARKRRRLRLRRRHDGGPGGSSVAGVAAHVPRARAGRPLSRRARRAGPHH